MSVLSYREFQKFLDNNQVKDISYKDYLSAHFGIGCYQPYKLYKTKKFLFFKRKVFLKNIPCGLCYACLKNRGKISLVGSPRSSFDLSGDLTSINLKDFQC